MPFALVAIGLIMIVTGARNTHAALGKQLTADFTGPNNFVWWIVALGAVGSLGYVEKLRPFSRAFIVLILLAMILANSKRGAAGMGFFERFMETLKSGPIAPQAAPGFSAGGLATSERDEALAEIGPRGPNEVEAQQIEERTNPNSPLEQFLFGNYLLDFFNWLLEPRKAY